MIDFFPEKFIIYLMKTHYRVTVIIIVVLIVALLIFVVQPSFESQERVGTEKLDAAQVVDREIQAEKIYRAGSGE